MGHLMSVNPENFGLSSSDVIFRLFADFLKQLRAVLIVEVFARQRARMTREAGDCLRKKIRFRRLKIDNGEPMRLVVHFESRASRIPVNCQRFSGWKKLRYVRRI